MKPEPSRPRLARADGRGVRDRPAKRLHRCRRTRTSSSSMACSKIAVWQFNAFGELTETVRILGGVTLMEALLLDTETGTDDNMAPRVSDVQVSPGLGVGRAGGRRPDADRPRALIAPPNTLTPRIRSRFPIGRASISACAMQPSSSAGTRSSARRSKMSPTTATGASSAESALTLSTPRRFFGLGHGQILSRARSAGHGSAARSIDGAKALR